MYGVLLTSSLLIFLHSAQCTTTGFLDSVSGEIPAGNFSYFTLLHPGIISLVLISDSGDCDIYVSQYESKPSFEDYAYCLQSSSCGVDTVIIPKSFKRPVSIGVYGHPSHEASECTLNIYQIDEVLDEEDDDDVDELYVSTKYGDYGADERVVVEEEYHHITDYESLPFLMIFFYYLYNILQYFLDLSVYIPFAPNEVIEIFLELLFF